MPKFEVWAVQLLRDTCEVEADDVEAAREKVREMYEKTGELDPKEVVTGGCGVVGDTEYVFKESSCADKERDDAGKTYYACPDCGCTDVECTAWVNVNGDEVSSADPPSDSVWCPQCSYNGDEGTMKYRFLVEVDVPQPVCYDESAEALSVVSSG